MKNLSFKINQEIEFICNLNSGVKEGKEIDPIKTGTKGRVLSVSGTLLKIVLKNGRILDNISEIFVR